MQGPIIAPPGSHPVAWMNIPHCLRLESSFTRTFLRSLSYSQLFKHEYDNNELVDRIERVAKRALAVVATLALATLDIVLGITIIPLVTRSISSLGPTIAMMPISLGMVSGYLPPTKGEFTSTSGDVAYGIARKVDEKFNYPEDFGARAARHVLNHAYQAFEVDRDRSQNYANDALVVAAEQGHVRGIEVLIKEGKADPNFNEFGKRALVIAAANCHVSSVKMLLKNGADPKLRTNWSGLDSITALLLGVKDCVSPMIPWDKRLPIAEPTSTPEQVATELVLAETPFNQQHIEDFSVFVKALKERNQVFCNAWLKMQEQSFYRILHERQIVLKDLTQWGKFIDEFSQGETTVNPFFVYMKGVSARHPMSVGAQEKNALWMKALSGKKEDVDAFVSRFESVREALYKARREVIWKREQAIIQACPSFPEAGIPNIISESCYS